MKENIILIKDGILENSYETEVQLQSAEAQPHFAEENQQTQENEEQMNKLQELSTDSGNAQEFPMTFCTKDEKIEQELNLRYTVLQDLRVYFTDNHPLYYNLQKLYYEFADCPIYNDLQNFLDRFDYLSNILLSICESYSPINR